MLLWQAQEQSTFKYVSYLIVVLLYKYLMKEILIVTKVKK